MNTPPFRHGHSFTAGTTGSGKTMAAIPNVLAAALAGAAVVVLDPHQKSLAWNCLVQLLLAGFERRIVFDDLTYFRRTPQYRLLRPSAARNPQQRNSQNEQTARNFANLLAWRSDSGPLAQHLQTEDWLMGVSNLAVYRDPRDEISPVILPAAFVPGHADFTRLLDGCYHQPTVAEFRLLGKKVSRSEILAAKRRVNNVCMLPAIVQRSGISLDLPRFLSNGGILLVQGGTKGVSAEAIRVVLGSIRHQVIRYVYDRPRPYPHVCLWIDEALNYGGLVDDVLLKFCAESRKLHGHVHLIAQAPSLSGDDLHNLLTNCSWHYWHLLTDNLYASRAAADLGDPAYRDLIKTLGTGERLINHRGSVYREYVPLPPDEPFEGLNEAFTNRALRRIRGRPEYQGAEPCNKSSLNSTNSSPSPKNTSSSPVTPGDSSPASECAPDDLPPFDAADGCEHTDE